MTAPCYNFTSSKKNLVNDNKCEVFSERDFFSYFQVIRCKRGMGVGGISPFSTRFLHKTECRKLGENEVKLGKMEHFLAKYLISSIANFTNRFVG